MSKILDSYINLDKHYLKKICFAKTHVHLNYKIKLKKVQSKQKHSLRIIFNLSKKYSASFPKTIQCTMPCLSQKLLLNKLLSTTNIPEGDMI